MTYKLLQNGRGVPLALSAEAAMPLHLVLENVPQAASLHIRTRNGAVYYREIIGGSCAVDLSHLPGEIEIGVVTTERDQTPKRWNCGKLTVWQTVQGALCAPSAADLAEKVNAVMLENDTLTRKCTSLDEKFEELEKKFEEFFEGYDVI